MVAIILHLITSTDSSILSHDAVIQEAFQIGIYWAQTNTLHKSAALKLIHDLTSPRWKEGTGSEVVTLDEDGFVEVDITLGAFPGRQKVSRKTI